MFSGLPLLNFFLERMQYISFSLEWSGLLNHLNWLISDPPSRACPDRMDGADAGPELLEETVG